MRSRILLFLLPCLVMVQGCGGRVARRLFGDLGGFLNKIIIIKLFRQTLKLSNSQIVLVFSGIFLVLGLGYFASKMKEGKNVWRHAAAATLYILLVAFTGLWWSGRVAETEIPVPDERAGSTAEADSPDLAEIAEALRRIDMEKSLWGEGTSLRRQDSLAQLKAELKGNPPPARRRIIYGAILRAYHYGGERDSLLAYMKAVVRDSAVSKDDIGLEGLAWSEVDTN